MMLGKKIFSFPAKPNFSPLNVPWKVNISDDVFWHQKTYLNFFLLESICIFLQIEFEKQNWEEFSCAAISRLFPLSGEKFNKMMLSPKR